MQPTPVALLGHLGHSRVFHLLHRADARPVAARVAGSFTASSMNSAIDMS